MKKYHSVTANLNKDGSPSIIAWHGKTFDTIPLSDGKGGKIKRVEPIDPAKAKAYADLHHFAELVLSDLNDRKTGWYYQFSAAVEKVRNHFPPVAP